MTPDSGHPSPDIIQFCVDLRHVVETINALGLKDCTTDLAFAAVVGVREQEAKLRGMASSGNMLESLVGHLRDTHG